MGENKQSGSTDVEQHLKTEDFPSLFDESRRVVFLFITVFSKTCFSRNYFLFIFSG